MGFGLGHPTILGTGGHYPHLWAVEILLAFYGISVGNGTRLPWRDTALIDFAAGRRMG